MKILRIRINHQSHLLQVLEIQSQNHIHVIQESKRSKGFVMFLSPPSYFAEPQFTCFVAESNFLIVDGYIMITPANETFGNHVLSLLQEKAKEALLSLAQAVFIAQVCIKDECRGKGIGKALYEHVFIDMKRRDYKCIITEVDAKNMASLKFHQSLGFESVLKYSTDGREFCVIKKDL